MANGPNNLQTDENGHIKRGPGRPKGSLNRTTILAKDVIQGVADKLGGLERMAAWAKEDPLNERAFWTNIYPKMLPLTVGGDKDNPVGIALQVLFK